MTSLNCCGSHFLSQDLDRNEPRCEKTGLRSFRPGLTQTGLDWTVTEDGWRLKNFGFRKKRDCTIRVAKTKALNSFAKLICVFVFAYAKSRFSHNEAQRTTCISQGFWPPLKPKIESYLQHFLWIVL